MLLRYARFWPVFLGTERARVTRAGSYAALCRRRPWAYVSRTACMTRPTSQEKTPPGLPGPGGVELHSLKKRVPVHAVKTGPT